jgi:hypothetical protein
MSRAVNPRRARAAHSSIAGVFASLALALGFTALPAAAQWKAGSAGAPSEVPLGTLQGRWVRPDGGYMIAIRSVGADGKLDAAYANPSPMPFSRAEASRDGRTIKVFLELRAGGYDGSTYTLTYDPASDVLKGVYYQAPARRSFDVLFARAKS